MAQAYLADSKLRMLFQVGMDEKGNPILKAKTFNNIKTEATADQLLQAVQAIQALASDELSKIERNDSSEILA